MTEQSGARPFILRALNLLKASSTVARFGSRSPNLVILPKIAPEMISGLKFENFPGGARPLIHPYRACFACTPPTPPASIQPQLDRTTSNLLAMALPVDMAI